MCLLLSGTLSRSSVALSLSSSLLPSSSMGSMCLVGMEHWSACTCSMGACRKCASSGPFLMDQKHIGAVEFGGTVAWEPGFSMPRETNAMFFAWHALNGCCWWHGVRAITVCIDSGPTGCIVIVVSLSAAFT